MPCAPSLPLKSRTDFRILLIYARMLPGETRGWRMKGRARLTNCLQTCWPWRWADEDLPVVCDGMEVATVSRFRCGTTSSNLLFCLTVSGASCEITSTVMSNPAQPIICRTKTRVCSECECRQIDFKRVNLPGVLILLILILIWMWYWWMLERGEVPWPLLIYTCLNKQPKLRKNV